MLRLLPPSTLVALAITACGGPPAADVPSDPVAYQDISLSILVATKPDGELVRASGAWGGVQAYGPRVSSDEFVATLVDGTTIVFLAVPKAQAAAAGAFAKDAGVTVEGRFEDQDPSAIVHVHRLVAQ